MPTVSYPKVPAKGWHILRARAAAAPSTKFTPTFVASLLGLANPESASANIVGPMRRLGLIDDDGSLTTLGNKWRIDASYTEACQEILDEIYPAELAGFKDATGAPDLAQINTWFQHKGFGDSNARLMASTYAMIAKKKIPDSAASESKTEPARRSRRPTEKGKSEKAVLNGVAVQPTFTPPPDTSKASGPNVHLDIQIHIPIEASAEQIDQIFASMAKHLYSQ